MASSRRSLNGPETEIVYHGDAESRSYKWKRIADFALFVSQYLGGEKYLSYFETDRTSCGHLLSRRRHLCHHDAGRRWLHRSRQGLCRWRSLCARSIGSGLRISRSRSRRRCRCRYTHGSKFEAIVLQSAADAAERLPEETRHDERLRLGSSGHEQTDLRRKNLRCIRRRTLRENLICWNPWSLDLCSRSQFQSAPPYVEIRRVFALACDVGNRDSRRSQTLGDAHLPTAANLRSRQRQLRHDFPLGNLRAVVLPLDRHFKTEPRHGMFRLRWSQPDQRGHGYFLPVNGKPHRR